MSNLDIQDFFGSINFGRVRGFFIKNQDFALTPEAATVLAQIACFQNSLPQGSPCSPTVSNLVGDILDVHLARLAATHGCTYTRYADDLSFSTNKREFPEAIAVQLGSTHDWVLGKGLTRCLSISGFVANSKKTRMQYLGSRQEVTGLIVNEKVNIAKEYRYRVRAMVHRVLQTGGFDISKTVVDASGKSVLQSGAGDLRQLHGMLAFIDSIDLYNRTLQERRVEAAAAADGIKRARPDITKKEEMYRRFLIFKELYTASMPVVVGEGKTDNIYLLHAIRSLAEKFPMLAEIGADKAIKMRVRLFKCYGTSTGRILRLRGGAPDLKGFLYTYKKEIARFKAPGMKHPVVMVIDSDDGAIPILKVVAQITKAALSGRESYIHVVGNLYVVPTPIQTIGGKSKIEDFFDDAVTGIKLNGKTFSADNDMDSDGHYGKVAFARDVVRAKAESIDFAGFHPLLENISKSIMAHYAKSEPKAMA